MTTFFERLTAKALLALRSRTCWTIATLLAAQLPPIRDQFSPAIQPVIDIFLALLACYFRITPNPTLNASIAAVDQTK